MLQKLKILHISITHDCPLISSVLSLLSSDLTFLRFYFFPSSDLSLSHLTWQNIDYHLIHFCSHLSLSSVCFGDYYDTEMLYAKFPMWMALHESSED